MSNDAILTLAPAASVANNIALSQTPSGAGNLTLAGSTVVAGPAVIQGVKYTSYAVLDIARRVQISDTGTSDTAVVFTISGFNRDGQPQSETIKGVTSATPANGVSFYDYLYVTSVAVSAATSGAITVGTVTATNATAGVTPIASSPWVLVNPYSTTWQLSAAANPTGTALTSGVGTYSIEHTYDDPNKIISPAEGGFIEAYGSQVPPVVFVSGANGKTAAFEYQYVGNPIQAHRVTIYAGTASGWAGGTTLTFWSLQGGIKS
jgi:hypothetical protein